MSKDVSLTNPNHNEVTVSMATYLSYDVDHTLILCFVRFEIAYVNVKRYTPRCGMGPGNNNFGHKYECQLINKHLKVTCTCTALANKANCIDGVTLK